LALAFIWLPCSDSGSEFLSPSAFCLRLLQEVIPEGKTNPILETTIKAAVNHYAKFRGTEVPLLESRLDHSHYITATTGMKLLAMLQGAWSMVVRRNPTINNGDWISYYDGSSTMQARKDTLWEGRDRVIQRGRQRTQSQQTGIPLTRTLKY
jgi:hypothetical protein